MDAGLSHGAENTIFKRFPYGDPQYAWDASADGGKGKSTISAQSRTSRTAPVVTITQKRFEDNQPSRDRARFEIGIFDADGAIEDKFKPLPKGTADDAGYFLTILCRDKDDLFQPADFKDASGTQVTEEVTVGDVSYHALWLSDSNFPTSSGAMANVQYTVTGLTAGRVYEMRIYGKYDLKDNVSEEAETMQVWSQQFATASLTSYGSISYGITSSHLKTELWPDGSHKQDGNGDNIECPYESATAQELSVGLYEPQTSPVLKGLASYILCKLTAKQEGVATQVMTASIGVEELKKLNVAYSEGSKWEIQEDSMHTGRYPLDWDAVASQIPAEDKTPVFSGVDRPKLYLEAALPEAGAAANAWDLFCDRGAKLIVRWDGETGCELSSNTEYQLSLQTFAFQGDAYHDISARSNSYKAKSFRTLKKMPYVTMHDPGSLLIVSNFIEMPNLLFHDEDRAIVGGTYSADGKILEGAVQASLTMLRGTSNIKNKMNIDLNYDCRINGETITGGVCEMLKYSGLAEGDTYELKLIPAAIVRDAANSSYTLRREPVYTNSDITLGSGLRGDIVLTDLSFAATMGEGEAIFSRSSYSLYEADDFTLGTVKSDGTGTIANTDGTIADDTDTVMSTRTATQAPALSPFIEVEEGGIYYFSGLRGESDTTKKYLYLYYYTNKDQGNQTPAAYIDQTTWKVAATGASDKKNANRSLLMINDNNGNIVRIPQGVKYIRFEMYGQNNATNNTKGIPAYVTAKCFQLKGGSDPDNPLNPGQGVTDPIGAVEPVMDPKDGSEFFRIETANNTTGYGKLIPVSPGDVYAVAQGNHWYYYRFLKADGTYISNIHIMDRDKTPIIGKMITVPDGAAYMQVWAYNYNNNGDTKYKTDPDYSYLYKVDKKR